MTSVLNQAVKNVAQNLIPATKLILPVLPYDYAALEPVISRDIMHTHHTKHHQAYINNYIVAEEKAKQALENKDIPGLLTQLSALNFNGGGHINHSIFWQNLSPYQTDPSTQFCNAIEVAFGNFGNMKKLLTEASIAIQGSGWGWLGYNTKIGCLQIATCMMQNSLESSTNLKPLLGVDVWEHAYYLQYKSARADYVKAIFDIVNWKDVSDRFENAACAEK